MYREFDFRGRLHGTNRERQVLKMSGGVADEVGVFRICIAEERSFRVRYDSLD